MQTFWATLANAAGGYGREFKVTGDTRDEVHRRAWSPAVGSEYLYDIKTEDRRTVLWDQYDHWTTAADDILPT